MVSIEISIEDISSLMGYNSPLAPDELNELLAFTISEVDSEPEGPDENGHTKIAIDIKTSNRPDLWCAEGIARVIRGRLNQPGLPPLQSEPSGFEVNVSAGLLNVRPYIGAAVVKDLTLDDFLIKQIIQLQEKVDFSYGRKRKRTSIGVYNVDMLESPIKYELVTRDFKFQPLQFDDELTVDEIFDQHPKGREYRHILDSFEEVPMLYDKNGLVLSMPPIINSDDVGRVTDDTSNVLIEVTGLNHQAVNVALLVIVQALRDRGGKVQSVKINYPADYSAKSEITPLETPEEITVDPKDINKYLGTNFTKKKIVDLLKKRTLNAKIVDKQILVEFPPWRHDILHWADISEEVAISADYNTLGPTDVQIVTPGKLDPSTEDENLIREILIGLRLVEVLNYSLLDKNSVTHKIERSEDWIKHNGIELSNPVSKARDILRPELLPGLIRFASRNTHVEYPQRIFETGECAVQEKNDVVTYTMASVLLVGAEETFETMLGILDTLTRLIKLEYELNPTDSHYYLSGRGAHIIINQKIVGHIGEISPRIIENYGIEMPVAAMEINLSLLPGLKCHEMRTNEIPSSI